jgi:hypothetical protein
MVTGYGGTYRGVVVDNIDPMQQYRLQVIVPDVWGDMSVWAAASMSAGDGAFPAVGETVSISFEHGDTDYPIWQPDTGTYEWTDPRGGYVGKYRGIVVANDDPMQENRLDVSVPDVDPSAAWAMPSDDVRYSEPPAVGAYVWIEYDHGDPAYPRWVGLA